MTSPDPKCQYCLGAGVRHNGYFEYPCSCIHRNIFNILPDLVIDSGIKAEPIEEFELDNSSNRIEEVVKIIADLMFSYINKDADCPHEFEIEAMENGFYFLQEFYTDGKYTTRMFENYINEMRED